jgi:hypothetical protein
MVALNDEGRGGGELVGGDRCSPGCGDKALIVRVWPRLADSFVAGSCLRPVELLVVGWSVDDGVIAAVPAVDELGFGPVAAAWCAVVGGHHDLVDAVVAE